MQRTIIPTFRLRWLLLSLNLLALSQLTVAQTTKPCYFPDGSRASGYQACDETADNSACCAISDNVVCLSSSLCYNEFGYIYRGACTDQTWGDSACPSDHCLDFQSSGMNILACDDSKGQWCCADGDEPPCCQNKNATQFYLNPGTVTFVAKGLSTLPTTSTSSVPSTTTQPATSTTDPAAATTSAPSATAVPATSNSLTVGASVGIAFGIAIPTIAAIIFGTLWWVERNKRENYEGGGLQEPILPPAPPALYGHSHGQAQNRYSNGGSSLQPPGSHQASSVSRSVSSELSTGYNQTQATNVMELASTSVKPPGYIGSY
ncbi:hypothetical protein TWF694_003854 [Orbilia ellipsospora]|uniref:Mid2 domain-containing protein n=1 Tax=Orbilia ellipsospora TaxID=2528407 RepID=A0AAV9WZD7_9PEZI